MADWPLHPLADMNSTAGWCHMSICGKPKPRLGMSGVVSTGTGRSRDGFLDRQPSSSCCGTPNVLSLSININSLSPLAVRVVRDFSP